MHRQMKHVNAYKLLIAAITLATVLTGCKHGDKKGTEKVTPESHAISTESDRSKETSSKTDVAKHPSFSNNNGHFVQLGDKIYFHIADADSMGRTALWAQYADHECGRTVLFEYDPSSESLETAAYDYTSGGLAVHGDALYAQAYNDFEKPEDPDSLLSKYSPADGDRYIDLSSTADSVLGSGSNGSYVATYHCDYANNIPTQQFSIYQEDQITGTFDVDGYCYRVKLGDNEIFYVGENRDSSYSLKQLDITDGSITDLGNLPEFENGYGYGHVDECIIDSGNIYCTYSLYEGTGNFFSGGYYVQAQIGKGNSLTYDVMPDRMITGELSVAWFKVENGKMVPAEGCVGTCTVMGNGDLGYYDENGEFIAVSDNWKMDFYNDDDNYRGVELAELVGDSIYLIYNENARAPEDDIGWRYAYYRNYIDVYRVKIADGESTRLLHQIAPWGD